MKSAYINHPSRNYFVPFICFFRDGGSEWLHPVGSASSTAQTPIANSAQAKAFKSGNQITIRWDKPIFDASFRADSKKIRSENFSCQLDFCTINWTENADILKARWTENGETFSKQFRF